MFRLGGMMGSRLPLRFAVAGQNPDLVAAFVEQQYRLASAPAAFSDLLSFARTGVATYFDGGGVLRSAASGVPRVGSHVFNGTSWVNKGLLLETNASTNGVRNNTMQGADAGTDTSPTNWAVVSVSGVTITVEDVGTEHGMEFIEYRCLGTAGASGDIRFVWDSNSAIAASQNEVWTQSAFIEQTGAMTHDPEFAFIERNAGGSALALGAGGAFSIDTNPVRYHQTRTLTEATTAFIVGELDIPVTNTDSVDCQFRIYLPQVEESDVPTSVIKTTGSAATRNAETLTIAAADTAFDATAFSQHLMGEVSFSDLGNTTELEFLRQQADSSNYVRIRLNTAAGLTGQQQALQTNAGTLDTAEVTAELTPGTDVPFNLASRHGDSFVQIAGDGAAGIENATPTALPDLSSADMQIGNIDFVGHVSLLRRWTTDIGETGIEEAST